MNYVIARPWYPEDDNSPLCIYTFHNEVQSGTIEDAQALLRYVKAQKSTYDYSIYKVKYKKVKNGNKTRKE